jgi:hypothetical protein
MDDWTREETIDGARDAFAMMRALIDGRRADAYVILDGAGERGVRCIAVTLLGVAVENFVRAEVAFSAIDDAQTRQVIASASLDQILAAPSIREAVETRMDGVLAALLAQS